MEMYSVRKLSSNSDIWAWSKDRLSQPLLALAAGTSVAILTAQGTSWTPARGGIKNIRGKPVVQLSWHPHRQILAIAWQDGAISIWDAASQHLEEDSKTHRHPPTHLLWHPGGKQLVTADTSGKVVLWDIDGAGQPAVASHSESSGGVRHLVCFSVGFGENSAAAAAEQATAAVCYAVGTPGCAAVTLKGLDGRGNAGVVQDIGEGLISLLYYEARHQIIAVTSSGMAIVLADSSCSHSTPADKQEPSSAGIGSWTVLLRMKVTSVTDDLQVCWAGQHTLALMGRQDAAVRMLQLDTDDNFMLDLNMQEVTSSSSMPSAVADAAAAGKSTGVIGLVYEPVQQVLAVATSGGWICLFEHWMSNSPAVAAAAATPDPASKWQSVHAFWVGPGLQHIAWGPTAQLVAAACESGLHVCVKSPLYHKLACGYAAVQVGTSRLLIQRVDGGSPTLVSTDLQLAGVDVTSGALLLHDGHTAEVHTFDELRGSIQLTARYEVHGGAAQAPGAAGYKPVAGQTSRGVAMSMGDGRASMALHQQCVFRTAPGCVEVCNWAGIVQNSIPFDECQGQPLLLDINSGYLAVLTSMATVRILQLSGSEVKPHAGPGSVLPSKVDDSLVLSCMRLNCDGSMVCVLASIPGSGCCMDPRLFVYSATRNGPLVLDLSQERTVPKAVAWDAHDPRLLVVQTGPLACSQRNSRPHSGDECASTTKSPSVANKCLQPADIGDTCLVRSGDVATVFATDEAGLLLQEFQDLDEVCSSSTCFIGVSAPHILLFNSRSGRSLEGTSSLQHVPLRCFAGLVDADDAMRKALLDFNYFLAVGRLEEAFKAVAALKNKAIWRNMAHMAIRNKQLPVAEHCLGKMQHVRGTRVLREAAAVPELNARVGLVAVQLGLHDEAARLFASCHRWDLLEELHTALGNWQGAMHIADTHDRVRQKAVQHAFGQHCEALGDMKAAMQHYINSGTTDTEVPRMLWRAGKLAELEHCVFNSSNAALLTWWARACEASGKFQEAISCYQKAGNQLSVLRIHCATGDWSAAEQLVGTSQDPAAAFHLARVYESQDRVHDALRCYTISKRYSHGARLAQRYHMDQELLSLALKSPPSIMLEAADYLLAAGNMQGAALLYQRGGKLGKAVQLACAAGMTETLDSITAGLDQTAEPDLINRCAAAFLSAGRAEAAVCLLLKVKQPERALDLLLEHEVPLTEERAEALTPEKTANNADRRNSILLRIAQAAKAQGLFHLACKKYTQAGDRLRAMRALIKSGDVEKIVFFTGVSRQREVYIMAANYLQTLNWRLQPEYLNHILSFYIKAGAADSLAQFYLGCAQTELCQFRAYDKGLQAMQEAAKHLAKGTAADKATQLAALEESSDRISRFMQAQHLFLQDPAAAVTICQQLLHEAPEQLGQLPDLAVGEVYALLVDWCYDQGSMPQVLQLVEQMLDRHVAPGHYLKPVVLAAVQQAMGAKNLDTQHAEAGSTEAAAVDTEAYAAGELTFLPDDAVEGEDM